MSSIFPSLWDNFLYQFVMLVHVTDRLCYGTQAMPIPSIRLTAQIPVPPKSNEKKSYQLCILQ